MIYSLTGTLVHTEPGAAVVDVGGVAFRCMTSMNTLRGLPRLSEKVTLYTYLNVREDALDLFGFATKGELSCFRLLTSISGVGPKVGLAILSQLSLRTWLWPPPPGTPSALPKPAAWAKSWPSALCWS